MTNNLVQCWPEILMDHCFFASLNHRIKTSSLPPYTRFQPKAVQSASVAVKPPLDVVDLLRHCAMFIGAHYGSGAPQTELRAISRRLASSIHEIPLASWDTCSCYHSG